MPVAEHMLLPPPGADRVPLFDEGWLPAGGATSGTSRAAFLVYVEHPSVNWSDDLEDMHEQSSRAHSLTCGRGVRCSADSAHCPTVR
jgi:hypothetical protein